MDNKKTPMVKTKSMRKKIFSFNSDNKKESLENCDFFRSDMICSNFSKKSFLSCNFNNVDASQALFIDCTFINCTFKHTNFSKATFKGCSFIFKKQETYSSENYLDYDSPFENSSFAEAQFLSSEKYDSSFKNAFFKGVGFKYANFNKVQFENFQTFSVSFENAKFVECISKIINLSNCSCSYLELVSNDFDKIIISEGKLFSVIGIEEEARKKTLFICRTDKSLPHLDIKDTVLINAFLKSSYYYFQKVNLVFELVNTLLITIAFDQKIDEIIEADSTYRINQLKILYKSIDPSLISLRAIIENYVALCLSNNTIINFQNIGGLLKLLKGKRIYDKHIYHSIMSLLANSMHQNSSEVSNALLMSNLLDYSKNISSGNYILKIILPNSHLENIEDITFLTNFINFLIQTANVNEYNNLQLIQGSLVKYLSFVSKADLKKVLFVTFLLGADIHVSPEHWEFNFNLKNLFVFKDVKKIQEFNRKMIPDSPEGDIIDEKFILIHNTLLKNKEKLSQFERSVTLKLSVEKQLINDSKQIVNMFALNLAKLETPLLQS